jgi:hypothetical protein
MGTLTVERVRTKAAVGAASVVAYAGAAAIAVAAGWYTLAAKGVTVATAPRFSAALPVEQKLTLYFTWVATTLKQERLYTSIAVAGFGCMIAVAVFARDLLGRHLPLARIAAMAVGIGASLWIAGNVLQLGANKAVGGMVTSHGVPLDTVGPIYFTAGSIDDAFELASFAFIAVGLFSFAAQAIGNGARAWGRYSAFLGVALLATVMSYVTDNGDLTDLLLLLGGVGLLPVWLVWTGRLLQREQKG